MGDARKKVTRIIEYTVSNFGPLGYVHFKPKSRVTVFSGRSGQGKTHILKGVACLLGGAKWEPEMPLRRGASSWKIEATLDGDRGAYTLRYNKSGLKIDPLPGCTLWGRPQEMVKTIMDFLQLDPMRFMGLEPAPQVDALLRMLGLKDELERLDEEIKTDEDASRLIRKDAERLEAEVRSIVVQDGLPDQKIDEAKIRGRFAAADEENKGLAAKIERRAKLAAEFHDAEEAEANHLRYIEEQKATIETVAGQLASHESLPALAAAIRDALADTGDKATRLPGASSVTGAIEAAFRSTVAYLDKLGRDQVEIRARLERERQALEAAEKIVSHMQQSVVEARIAHDTAPVGELIDTVALMEELDHAQQVNREIDKRARWQAKEAEWRAKEEEYNVLRRAIDTRRIRKRNLVSEAKMPVEGLMFESSDKSKQVLYNGIPLKQWGRAKQIEIAIQLVLARDPDLRLVLIDGGEALDDESMENLKRLAEEQDFYVWMTVVDKTGSGKMGVFIEGGAIKVNNYETGEEK